MGSKYSSDRRNGSAIKRFESVKSKDEKFTYKEASKLYVEKLLMQLSFRSKFKFSTYISNVVGIYSIFGLPVIAIFPQVMKINVEEIGFSKFVVIPCRTDDEKTTNVETELLTVLFVHPLRP